jgi:hypothetical protein
LLGTFSAFAASLGELVFEHKRSLTGLFLTLALGLFSA